MYDGALKNFDVGGCTDGRRPPHLLGPCPKANLKSTANGGFTNASFAVAQMPHLCFEQRCFSGVRDRALNRPSHAISETDTEAARRRQRSAEKKKGSSHKKKKLAPKKKAPPRSQKSAAKIGPSYSSSKKRGPLLATEFRDKKNENFGPAGKKKPNF